MHLIPTQGKEKCLDPETPTTLTEIKLKFQKLTLYSEPFFCKLQLPEKKYPVTFKMLMHALKENCYSHQEV